MNHVAFLELHIVIVLVGQHSKPKENETKKKPAVTIRVGIFLRISTEIGFSSVQTDWLSLNVFGWPCDNLCRGRFSHRAHTPFRTKTITASFDVVAVCRDPNRRSMRCAQTFGKINHI